MAVVKLSARQLRILDIDLENRPLSYLGSDWTTDEITAIAYSWADQKAVHTFLLNREGEYEDDAGAPYYPALMLEYLKRVLLEADVVTGHFIRRHDLPLLNGACLEYGLHPLPELLTQDTKSDLVSAKGMSKSQENLGEALNLPAPKQHMNQVEWRRANRLTTNGVALTRARVVADVVQHKALRKALVAQGLLRPPCIWRP